MVAYGPTAGTCARRALTRSNSTDANLYALVPGGRPDTNYIWQLDLNNFAGFGYAIIANDIGVNAPNSGFSTDISGNSASYEYSVYLGVPARSPTRNQPSRRRFQTLRFIDSAGEDSGISPGTTIGVQDSGVFEFDSDVEATYDVTIDTDQNGVFGNAGDVRLIGAASVGANSVSWDGTET